MSRVRRGSERTERRRTVRSPPPAGGTPSRPDARRAVWWCAGAIVLAGILAYSNSLSGPFILDDAAAIPGNRTIRRLTELGTVLFPDRDSSVAGRPLVNLSLAVNYAVGGLDVRGYHVWNIAIHLLCALTLFGVVRRTLETPRLNSRFGSRAVGLAFAAALIWTLHPLNTEAVNYLTQRTETMMALFYLLTLYCSIRSHGPTARPKVFRKEAGHYSRVGSAIDAAHDDRRASRWQIGAVAACALGMLCKETMATAPLAVLLYERSYIFGSFGEAFRARWRFYAGLAAAWVPLAPLIASGPRAGVAGFSAGFSPWTYLLNQAVMLTHYLRLAVWPRSLVVFYGWPIQLALRDVLPQALLVVALLLVALWGLSWHKAWGFPAAWCFLTLAPSSTVIPITTEVGAERRMYLALAGLIVLAVAGAAAARRRGAGGPAPEARPVAATLGVMALVAVCAALAARTIARNREYASALDLARTVVERRPTSVAHHIYGVELVAAGRHDEALAELRTATAGDSRALYDLGLELFNRGRLQEAIDTLQAYVGTWRLPYRLVPHWLEPPVGEVLTSQATLARAFGLQGRWADAAEHAGRVLAIAPSNAEARALLGQALLGQERFDEAAAQLREYLKVRPDDFNALGNLGVALANAGKTGEAVEVFRRAVAVDPRNAAARRNLASALYDARQAPEAAAQAEQAIALAPNDAVAHDVLGRAWAVQGRLDEARQQFERALQIDPSYAEAREDLRRLSALGVAPRTRP